MEVRPAQEEGEFADLFKWLTLPLRVSAKLYCAFSHPLMDNIRFQIMVLMLGR